MRAARWPAAGALLALLLGGCVTPARNDPQYRAKASAALQATASELGTTLLIVRQVQDGKALKPYADAVVTASETSMGGVINSFGSVQPPDPGVDAVRDGVSGVLSSASDAIAHARIAVRRPGTAQLAAVTDELVAAEHEVDRATEQLR